MYQNYPGFAVLVLLDVGGLNALCEVLQALGKLGRASDSDGLEILRYQPFA